MSEETNDTSAEEEKAVAAAKKKPAAKKAPSKAASASRKTPKKAPKKAAAKKPSAQKEEANAPNDTVTEDIEVIDITDEISSNTSDKRGINEDIFNDLKDRDWAYIGQRAIMMILFGFIGWAATIIGLTLTFIHFFVAILTGGPHKELVSWINKCGCYVRQIFKYLSYETDEPPFPLGKSSDCD